MIINTIFIISILVVTFRQITDPNIAMKKILKLNKPLPRMIDNDTRLEPRCF